MAEYIERDGVILDILCAGKIGKQTCVDIIKNAPAADVRHVVRGEWTNKRTIEHDGEWWCTACGKEITIYMGADRKDRYKFCPNCGADMMEMEESRTQIVCNKCGGKRFIAQGDLVVCDNCGAKMEES